MGRSNRQYFDYDKPCFDKLVESNFIHKPMKINLEETAVNRWANKEVLESRLLDNMESPANWTHEGFGEMTFIDERSIDGKQSIRLTSPSRAKREFKHKDSDSVGYPFGIARLCRKFDYEDWSAFNRISFWVYPTLPGFRVISILVRLHNEGTRKVPDKYDREGLNYVLLKADQWNHVVWEIPHLSRDRVTGLSFTYRLQGNIDEAAGSVCFDFDCLELQKVEADHYEGWNTAPGQISFSHTGYHASSPKSAVASDIPAEHFKLINLDSGKVVLSKPIRNVGTHLGKFKILDFSEIREPGTYILQAGDIVTRSFRIDDSIWRGTVWKTINLFFCERCGMEVPGIHGPCHRDWQCVHGDKKIIINGGWHDAGDLSQGLVNTSEAVYAMFSLAKKYKDEDTVLYERLIEEAKWGLDWMLKTRFGDGYRQVWGTMDIWTDGIIGNDDDCCVEARNMPFANFVAAAAEALAGRMLKYMDPILSDYCLRAAHEDWQFGLEAMEEWDIKTASFCLLAAIELYKANPCDVYSKEAFARAEYIMGCQQDSYMDWDIPMAGFFYTDTSKKAILHYDHVGQEQAPIVALSELCGTFPGHEDWIRWYSAVALYSEYVYTAARYTEPYGMLPGSIYRLDESDRETYKEQVLNGIKLDENHYLRLFPVWYDFRGNNGTGLSQAKALSAAGQLRGSQEMIDLCQQQLQWVVGRNPFNQSLMYGEGYDYAPQYTALSGDMAGSLPVGIQTRENNDIPYWSSSNCYNYKEVWVHPSSRWLWLMEDLEGPAGVAVYSQSEIEASVEFEETGSGRKKLIKPGLIKSGPGVKTLSAVLSPGAYVMHYNGFSVSMSFLPGRNYDINLDELFDFEITTKATGDSELEICLSARGGTEVDFELRTWNLTVCRPGIKMELSPEKESIFTWSAHIQDRGKPCILVIIPNGDMFRKKEIFLHHPEVSENY